MGYRIAIGPSSFAEADPEPLHRLEQAGCEIVPNPHGRRLTEDEIIAHLDGVDGLIAGLEPLNRTVITAAPQLKAIARVGIGVTNVDFVAAEEHGVAVSSTPDGPIDAVAEMTVAALLSILREIIPSNRALHEGTWEKRMGRGLRGTKVLLVGYGRIGRRVFDLLHAFGAEVIRTDPNVADAELLTLHEGLAAADVVSLHASGDQVLIGPEEFDIMRDGVILLNSARGELVDEAALIKALESGRVGACWFDAFVEEPYAGPLTTFDQVLLTPHVSTYTRECRRSMETAAVENLLRDLGA